MTKPAKLSLSAAAYAAEELLRLMDGRLLPHGKSNVCPGCGALPLHPHEDDCVVQQVRKELREKLKNFTPGGSDPSMREVSKVRLSRQAVAIRDRLLEGPATNIELAAMALKYTSRISDLRACGYEVFVAAHDHETGRVTYAMKPCA